MLSLPEIAARIADKTGADPDALHTMLRGYRDKGVISHVDFQGRKAMHDDAAIAKLIVLMSLQGHGFEGVALHSILSLLENHNAPVVPDVPQRVGFRRVVEGIKKGEQWSFLFTATARKTFYGSCRLQDAVDPRPGESLVDIIGAEVTTQMDLTRLVRRFLDD